MRRLDVAERAGWRDSAARFGFDFMHSGGRPYWDESACFAFTLERIERDIEEPSAELHALCLDLAERASRDAELLTLLGVPEAFHDYVAESWRRRETSVFGRFDLGYDGTGPAKLLEYNADTPTSLFEAAVFQWMWLEEMRDSGALPADADQFNRIHEALIDGFRALPGDRLLHFAGDYTNAEDRGTLDYLRDCAMQAGLVTWPVDIRMIGIDDDGLFRDERDVRIDGMVNLYPWEWMFTDSYGAAIPQSGTLFVEPAWKAMLSTKAILPLLWQWHPGHPNLLPAYFEGDGAAASLSRFVRKPVFSREGANISLHEGGQAVAAVEGPYGDVGARWIVQQAAPLFRSPAGYAVIGSWIVGGEACGIGLREDSGPITMNLSRFLPHAILG